MINLEDCWDFVVLIDVACFFEVAGAESEVVDLIKDLWWKALDELIEAVCLRTRRGHGVCHD